MNAYEFAGWVSRLCTMNEGASDAEFVAALRSFAAECGVKMTDKAIAEYFRLDDDETQRD